MIQKTRWILFLLVTTLFLNPAKGQVVNRTPPFRIVGYYSLQAAMSDSLHTVPFELLTHINLWFLNPDSLGNYKQDYTALAPFITTAHAKGIKVLASIGGGTAHPYYKNLLREENRKGFIEKLVSVVRRYNLDGIDVDLEGDDIDENYEGFVTDLATSLRSDNKLITAAIAVYYKDKLTDKALAQYDFVNIMSYDRTGPWRPEKPGPHATYAHAAEDLDYFGVTRSIPKEKMVLGVPFYGYGFDPQVTAPAISLNYGQIVTQFPGAASADEIKMPDGKTLYYNGLATIKQKTALAKEKASGIMIWQVKGDAKGRLSLLQAINDAAKEK